MAIQMKVEGLDELSEMISSVSENAEAVASGALFDGAAVAAKAFKTAVNSIKTQPFSEGRRQAHKRLPSPEEKAALMGKTGIAKFEKNGSEVNTTIGVSTKAGYAMIGSKAKPIPLIARAINSGTSFMKKQPVFRKAVNSAKGAASAAMVAKAEAMLDALTK